MVKTAFAVSVAGSDPSAGAGLQADLKTMTACGVWGMTVIAALTAQNANRVACDRSVDAQFIQDEISVLEEDFAIGCYKTGMLKNAATVHAVASGIPEGRKIVADPVLLATRGYRLLGEEGQKAFVGELLPKTTVATPNLPEAEALSGIRITDAESMEQAAYAFLDMGAEAVVVKGGHASFRTGTDLYADRDGILLLEGNRYPFADVHGSGCCFASAIAAHIALGHPVREAAERAKAFTDGAIRYAVEYAPGRYAMNPDWKTHRTYG